MFFFFFLALCPLEFLNNPPYKAAKKFEANYLILFNSLKSHKLVVFLILQTFKLVFLVNLRREIIRD